MQHDGGDEERAIVEGDLMKASDIPDGEFLEAVDDAIGLRGPGWCIGATRWDVAAVLAKHPEDVGGAHADYPDMPEKVVLAKARKLIKRGLMDGCSCGCRGGFKRVDQA